jgi:DNA-binding response OmpR family regulator
MTRTRRILVIEDDRDLAELTRLHLQDEGYEVEVAHDGRRGRQLVSASSWDLILLDLMLPGGVDGLQICREVRARDAYTPLLMLTARSAEVDRVIGLELGADDYITKPFSLRELMARVKAHLRRVDVLRSEDPLQAETIEHRGLRVDVPGRQVSLDGEEVLLTAMEFDLLIHFLRHPGRVFQRSELLDRVWGLGYQGYEHTVNTHINRLRRKIERDPSRPTRIVTVWGVGYKLGEGAGG